MIYIVSTIEEDWGGSEEFWFQLALSLLDANESVTFLKAKINRRQLPFKRLTGKGCRLLSLGASRYTRAFRYVNGYRKKYKLPIHFGEFDALDIYKYNRRLLVLGKALKRDKPKLVIINQGLISLGLDYAYICLKHQIPYLLICHKADELYRPPTQEMPYMSEAIAGAQKIFFVSRHNWELVKSQFGMPLHHASLFFNPLKVKIAFTPLPSMEHGIKLLCIARLDVFEKGQDILLKVLAKKKWQERQVSVTFLGKGKNEQGLKELSVFLGLKQVRFEGYHEQVTSYYQSHHAIILPSRTEGLPLVIKEAMALGRLVICTNAGGAAEEVDDGKNGFIGEATVSSLDSTLERAWQRKESWQWMVDVASQKLRHIKDHDSIAHFMEDIKAYI